MQIDLGQLKLASVVFSWLMSWQWLGLCYKSHFYISQHKEFHTFHQIPPKKNAFPFNPVLLLWLASSSQSVHAPGHSSVGKDSRVAWVPIRGYPAWSFFCSERYPREICEDFDHFFLETLCRKECLCMHRSVLWHTGGTLGDLAETMTGMCIEPSHPHCTAQRCRLLGDPRKKYLTVLLLLAPHVVRADWGISLNARHSILSLSPALQEAGQTHVGGTALRHQISLVKNMWSEPGPAPNLGFSFCHPQHISQALSLMYVGTLAVPSGDREGMEWAEGWGTEEGNAEAFVMDDRRIWA